MIPVRQKDTDIASEIAQGKFFKKRLTQLVEEASERFLQEDSLNEVVAELSIREGLNAVQVQRFVEEVNTISYNKRYNQVKKNNDRRISFDLANIEEVLTIMGEQAPERVVNPNIPVGKPGEGEITKEASVETYLHSLHKTASASRERLRLRGEKTKMEQRAHIKKARTQAYDDAIFKIANAIVMSEKLYKNANEVYGRMLETVSLNDTMIEGIEKRANQISQHLVDTKRWTCRETFTLTRPTFNKKANTDNSPQFRMQAPPKPKVAPVNGIGDLDELISLATLLEQQAKKQIQPEEGV